jgi:DNA repair protein RadA/Sms
MEGTRPLLVEIQALVSQTSFGMPRRRSMGIDFNRTSLLTAVLEKRCQMALQMQDIFVNVAGGVSIVEPAADLAVVTAIASGFRERPVAAEDVVFGEVGLGGEVRAVSQVALRIREIQQLGFKRVIMPQANVAQMREHGMPKNLHVEGVTTVRQALDCVLSG